MPSIRPRTKPITAGLLLSCITLLAGCDDESSPSGLAPEPPTAVDVTVSTSKNASITAELRATDPNGDRISFSVLSPPSNGSLSAIFGAGDESASITYTPNLGFSGTDSFRYRASDGTGSATGTVTIQVVNSAPEAASETVRRGADASVVVELRGTDPDGDPVTFEIVDPPADGTLGEISIVRVEGPGGTVLTGPEGNGSPPSLEDAGLGPRTFVAEVVYTPDPGSSGVDLFRYRVSDGEETSETAEISIEANEAPEAFAFSTTIGRRQPVAIPLDALDADGDFLTFELVGAPSVGTLGPVVQLGPDQAEVIYTPNPAAVGEVSFGFRVTDGLDTSETRTVTIVVQNLIPVAFEAEAQTGRGFPVAITLTGEDGDQDHLTFEIVDGPSEGSLGSITQLDPFSARVIYTADADAVVGDDTFTFRVTDGSDASAPATVTVSIAADPEDQTFETAGNTELRGGSFAPPATPHISVGNLLAATPGLVIQSTGTFATTNGGSVTIEADGDFLFTPSPGDAGPDSFDFTVNTGPTATVTVNITDMVWYVDNTAAGGTGVSSDPFATLAGAEGASGPGDRIFVYRGDGTTTGYDAGITLQANQRLTGEVIGLTVPPFGTLVAPGGRPLVTNAAGDAIALADGSTVEGLDVAASVTGTAIVGAAVDGSTIDDVNVLGGASAGLSLSGSTGTFTVTDLDIDGVIETTLEVSGGDPALSVDLGGNTWTNAAGRIVSVQNTTGGGVTLSNGTLSDTGDGVFIDNAAGTVSVQTTASITTSTARGVELTNSTGTVTFADLTVDATGFTGLHVNGLTSLEVTTGSVSATNGLALDLNNSGLDLTLTSASSANSATRAIAMNAVSGTVDIAGGTITGTGDKAFDINGGSADVTYGGSITHSTGRSVEITNWTGGTITMSGDVTDTGWGILLVTNAGTVLDFTGELDITTNGTPAFTASASGTLTVTGTGSNLDATAERAVNIENTTIGSSGVTFESVSSDGGINGIRLVSTGAGAFTVTGLDGGDGDTDPDVGSGGTIANSTADAITLTSASNVSLSGIIISNPAGNGVFGTGLTASTPGSGANAFTYRFGEVNGAGDAGSESGFFFGTGASNNVRDAVTIDNVILDDYHVNGIHILNTSVDANITVSNTTFRDADDAENVAGILVETPTGSTAGQTLTVSGSTFGQDFGGATPSIDGAGISFQARGSGTHSITVGTSRFTDISRAGAGTGVEVTAEETATVTVDVSNNLDGNGHGFRDIDSWSVDVRPLDNSTITGTINNNTVLGPNILGDGIRILGDGGDGTLASTFTGTFEIDGNTISTQDFPIQVNSLDTTSPSGRIDVNITNNTISGLGDLQESVFLSSNDSATLCANVTGNAITTGGIFDDIGLVESGASDLRIAQTSAANLSAVNGGASVVELAGTPTYSATCNTP